MMSKRRNRLNPTFRSAFRRFRQATIGRRVPPTNGALYNPFFIVGSGRSGTTLLRRILCTNPDIHIPGELDITDLINNYDKHSKLRWREFVKISLAHVEYTKIQFQYSFRDAARYLVTLPKNEQSLANLIASIAKFDAKEKGIEFTRWGDKMPYNVTSMNEILYMFPDARFIHLYRDGCDVVQSFVHYGIYKTHEEAADVWLNSVRCAEQFTHRDRLYSIRYEDLVDSPERYVLEICEFLDITFNSDMLVSNEKAKLATSEAANWSNQENLHKSIFTGSIGKGRAAMPQEQREKLAPQMDPWLKKLGYKSCLES